MNLNHFFSLDSPLMTILTRIGNLIILNLLFIAWFFRKRQIR